MQFIQHGAVGNMEWQSPKIRKMSRELSLFPDSFRRIVACETKSMVFGKVLIYIHQLLLFVDIVKILNYECKNENKVTAISIQRVETLN